MSLNHREIDQILQELALPGCAVQGVVQPDFRNLFLQLFRPPRAFWVRICLATPWVRLHRSEQGPGARRSHQRFEELLAARIKGGRIESAEQLFSDRIVRLTITHAAERYALYCRLWGGAAANVILTSAEGTIIDAFFRKPAQGMVSGGQFVPTAPGKNGPHREVRAISPAQSLNEAIDEYYDRLEQEQTRELEYKAVERLLIRRRGRLSARAAEVYGATGGAKEGPADPAELRREAELLLAHAHLRPDARGVVEILDYYQDNRPREIQLGRRETPAQAAARLFTTAAKQEQGQTERAESRRNLEHQLQRVEEQLASLHVQSLDELRPLRATLEKSDRGTTQRAQPQVGLRFESRGFEIIVGRNAAENDALLRRAVRGNDTWLHTRDVSGGYVFIKNRVGQSIPLDVLLDAGNLALFFSKARRSGTADLYYTQVKYLRRAKNAALGTVLPTQEKNLTIRMDAERLKSLGIGEADW